MDNYIKNIKIIQLPSNIPTSPIVTTVKDITMPEKTDSPKASERKASQRKAPERKALYLFKYGCYQSLHRSTKFLIYCVLKNENALGLNMTDAELNKELLSLDWLTFEWNKLPKFVFEEVFNINMCKGRLLFMVGYFKTYFGPADITEKKNVVKMIESLWDHFNSLENTLEDAAEVPYMGKGH